MNKNRLEKQGGKINILEFLKNGNKIKKAQLGTNLDVDTRSDTTRQGRHEGTTYFGAANQPNTWGILDWLNELDRQTNKSRSDSPIYNPNLNMGVAPSVSRGDQIWEYLHSFVTKHPQVLKSFPTIGKGFIKGNGMSVGQVVQPLEGLSVRQVKPLNLSNPVNNAAEKAAAEDFMKETGLVVNTKMPTGRPKGDYKYPQKILERTPKVVRKDFQNAKVTQNERYHDNRDFSKRDRTLDKNARAYESKKATPVNSGRSRVHENQNSNDWETLSKYKEYAKRQYKIQERLNKYPKGSNEYKQAFKDRKALIEEYRNKYRFLSGGVLDFLKNGSSIYIKPSKRGSFTKYCNGKVTEECIARGKRSPSAAIRKKATFAANSRKWSKN